jgi:hypothetical protein
MYRSCLVEEVDPFDKGIFLEELFDINDDINIEKIYLIEDTNIVENMFFENKRFKYDEENYSDKNNNDNINNLGKNN